jgi:YggT family protein
MLTQAAIFLVETIIGLFSLALLLRFFLQLFRAPFRNPLSQFVCALTDFMVLPARRVIPGLWGMDLATLVLAWSVEVVLLLAVLGIKGADFKSGLGTVLVAVAILALIRLVKMAVYILMVAVIVQAIVSWLNPYNPIGPMLSNLTQPFLRPLQKRVPTVGNVDLSPLVLIIVLQLILMVPVAWIELNVARLF